MKRTPLRRKTPLRSQSALRTKTHLRRRKAIRKVNPARRRRERLRAYGPEERRKWMTSLPCVVPGCRRRSEQAHVTPPEGLPSGMGRKRDARWTVPCCAWHHRLGPKSMHDGEESFQELHGINLPEEATRRDTQWEERMAA
jgi:hypothetical protein